ncbi:MAG TPA: alpha/beta hydrolase family protein [Xanthobacteraceae bacterium]
MLGWQRFLQARERALAAESEPAKFAGAAAVGLEYLGSPGGGTDELARLIAATASASRDAETFFTSEQRPTFRRQGAMLTFDSPGGGDGPNGIARAQIYESRHRDRAIVLLPYWNAPRAAAAPFGALLARCGVTCVQLSLPYHDERRTPGSGFARELACENLGLTLRANRQAVLDARACLSWLEREGYARIGIVGVSIGASIASIVAALDPRVSAAALLLMADDFAEVVWTGSATRHVRASLERAFSRDDVRAAWSIISPASHAARLSARLDRLLIVSGELDTVFLPALTRDYVERLRGLGLHPTWMRYGCGHYTLGLPFYAARCFLRTLAHLRATL